MHMRQHMRRTMKVDRALFRAIAIAITVTSAITGAFAACAPEPPKAPHTMRPLSEDRAAEIMGHAFRASGFAPERNRTIHLARDKPIRLEVAAADHKFGVAYVTEADAERLGDAIPERPRGTDSLLVVRGEQGTRILLLFEGDYVEDDLEGESHTTTTIAAERKIERDARDFLYKATHEAWP
jgi:hypothetical protein